MNTSIYTTIWDHVVQNRFKNLDLGRSTESLKRLTSIGSICSGSLWIEPHKAVHKTVVIPWDEWCRTITQKFRRRPSSEQTPDSYGSSQSIVYYPAVLSYLSDFQLEALEMWVELFHIAHSRFDQYWTRVLGRSLINSRMACYSYSPN
jgi:hypothetical protein